MIIIYVRGIMISARRNQADEIAMKYREETGARNDAQRQRNNDMAGWQGVITHRK